MTPEPSTFGKDHWSTLAYVESRIVDFGGAVDRAYMRCNPARHPLLAHEGSAMGAPSPTRLRGGALLHDHDDWDCVDDLEVAGWVEAVGTGMNPVYRVTADGLRVAGLLRAHKAGGGTFSNFADWLYPSPAAFADAGGRLAELEDRMPVGTDPQRR